MWFKSSLVVFLLSVLMVLAGGWVARDVQTNNGTTAVKAVSIDAPWGQIAGRLYRPLSATATSPAPAILITHGYTGTRESQDSFALEYVREGWVVLNMELPGHGDSDPPVKENIPSSVYALDFLHEQDFVDSQNIGLHGHSMGSYTVRKAAELRPDGYRAVLITGGTIGEQENLKTGDATFPKNIAIATGFYDEFAWGMWGVNADELSKSSALQQLFGREQIVAETLYGDLDQGSGRILHQPPVDHAGVVTYPGSINFAKQWFADNFQRSLVADGLRWEIKAHASAFMWLGFWLCVFASVVLFSRFLGSAPHAPVLTEHTAPAWLRVSLVTLGLLSLAFTYIIAQQKLAGRFTFPFLWQQQFTTGFLAWLALNAALAVGLVGLLKALGKIQIQWRNVLPKPIHIIYGVAVLLLPLALLWLSEQVFYTDFRWAASYMQWLNSSRWLLFISYWLPMWACFIVFAVVLLELFPRPSWGALYGALAVVALLVVLSVAQRYFGALEDHSMRVTIARKMLPVLAVVLFLLGIFYRHSRSIHPGAAASSALLAWIMVSGQATHF